MFQYECVCPQLVQAFYLACTGMYIKLPIWGLLSVPVCSCEWSCRQAMAVPFEALCVVLSASCTLPIQHAWGMDSAGCCAGRNKWNMAAAFSDSAAPAVPLSPEAVETARRAYSAGAACACHKSPTQKQSIDLTTIQ